jgi:hypothetical protein
METHDQLAEIDEWHGRVKLWLAQARTDWECALIGAGVSTGSADLGSFPPQPGD